MKHEEITKEIIGSAITVLNELKPGLDEKLYENALVIELVARGPMVEQQREYPVHYRSLSRWISLSKRTPIPNALGNKSPGIQTALSTASAYAKDDILDVADRNCCLTSRPNQFDPVRHASSHSRGFHEHCLNVRESPCNTG